MKIRSAIAAANIGFMFLVVGGTPAEAAEIKVMAANAIQEVMEDLGTKFERATGHKIAFTFAPIGGVVKRLEGGETADVVIINPQGIDGFIRHRQIRRQPQLPAGIRCPDSTRHQDQDRPLADSRRR